MVEELSHFKTGIKYKENSLRDNSTMDISVAKISCTLDILGIRVSMAKEYSLKAQILFMKDSFKMEGSKKV